jgi:PKD repeat protein
VKITGNSAGRNGGGIFCGWSSNPSLVNVTITGNSAGDQGGGIHCYYSNPTLTNVTITGNSAYDGGGMNLRWSSPNLEYVTITNNSASDDGGGILSGNSSSNPNIVNTIVSDNTGNYGIYLYGGLPTIEYCDVYNNENGNFYINYECDYCQYIGTNVTTNANGDSCDMWYNIQENPLFVDTANGDYHLTENSPCIDAGDPNSPLDPDGTIADMGAYFYNQALPDADFTSDVTTGNPPLTVQFTDNSSSGSLEAPLVSWNWNFGDGTSTEQNPSHTFQSGGIYTITLNITDSLGFSDSEIKEDYIYVIATEIHNLDIGGDEDLQHLITHTPLIMFDFYSGFN